MNTDIMLLDREDNTVDQEDMVNQRNIISVNSK